MPYRPTELSVEEQIAQYMQSHPDAQRAFIETKAREGLNNDQMVEKHPEMIPFLEKPLDMGKAEYYEKHPHQDPRSMASYFLGALGMDRPYANNEQSVDYRAHRNEKTADWHVGPNGERVPNGADDPLWNQGYMPKREDVDEFVRKMFETNKGDDRDWKERTSGAILQGLKWPLFGYADEAVAGTSSLLNGTNYEDELQKARDIQQRYAEYEPDNSIVNIGATGAGLVTDLANPLAPWNLMSRYNPVSWGGNAAKYLLGYPATGAADLSLLASGNSDADTWQGRLDAADDPETLKMGAAMGGAAGLMTVPLAWPAIGAAGQVGYDYATQEPDGEGNTKPIEDFATFENAGKGALKGLAGGVLWRGLATPAFKAGKAKVGEMMARRGAKDVKAAAVPTRIEGPPMTEPPPRLPVRPRDAGPKLPLRPVEEPINPRLQPTVRDDLERAMKQSRARDRG